MAHSEPLRLNIRSRFARKRAADLARETGMTMTQIVEEALRAYQPTGKSVVRGKLVRKGRILVRSCEGKRVTARETEVLLDESRNARR